MRHLSMDEGEEPRRDPAHRPVPLLPAPPAERIEAGEPAVIALQRTVGNQAVARLLAAGRRDRGEGRLARQTHEQTSDRAKQIWVGSGRPQLAPGSAQEVANWQQAEADLQAVDARATAAAGGATYAQGSPQEVGVYLAAEKDHYLHRLRSAYPPAAQDPTIGATYDSGALRCLYDFRTFFLPLIAGDAARMKNLGAYINSAGYGGQTAYVERAEALLSYNRLFGLNVCRPPVQPHDFPSFVAILQALDGAAAPDRQVALGVGSAVVDKLLDTVDKARVLRMLGVMRRSGGVLNLVSRDSAPVLERIFVNYPPGRFAGFAAWGPGNHGTPESNKLEHFAKHVLRDFGAGETAPPMEEQVMWWWGLNLSIGLDVVCSPAVIHPKLLDLFHGELVGLCGVGPSSPGFPAAAAAVKIDHNLPEGLKLLTTMSQRVPTVGANLFDRMGAKYVNFAITASRNMRDVQVHLSQNDYFISGVFENVYVVGRVIDGVAGISAAYWTSDPRTKTEPASNERLWAIKD